MQKRILITAVTGTGKTSVGKHLEKMGYESTDIENIDGMFAMYHRGTKKIFPDYDHTNPDHDQDADWICDINKLASLLKSQKSNLAFYTGIANNMNALLPFFDQVFVLYLDSPSLNKRLKNREGTDDVGSTQASRDIILSWKDQWESEMKKTNSVFINANRPLAIIADDILSKTNQH